MEHLIAWLDEERGRRIKLAAALNIVPHAISKWHRVPVEHVLKVEKLTGISRHDLRPDIYPREDAA